MREIFTTKDAADIVSAAERINRARVTDGIAQRPFSVQRVPIDLSVACLETDPKKISFPFKSIYVQDGTDTFAQINVKLGNQDTTQSPFVMRKNDAVSMDYPMPNAFLHWEAQPGKQLVLIFFTEAKFESGSQISVTGGGVSIVEGSTFTNAAVTLGVATATEVFPQNLTRKVGTFRNSDAASVWVGTSSVDNSGAFIEIKPGEVFEWRNTAQLYAYSVLGCDIPIVEEF